MSLLPNRDDLFAFTERQRGQYEHLLKEFVAVPTVSSEPNRQPDIERGVELATETIRSFGGKAKVHRSKGANPIIYAAFDTGKGCPTVTVYNHLDVQPASPETEPWINRRRDLDGEGIEMPGDVPNFLETTNAFEPNVKFQLHD